MVANLMSTAKPRRPKELTTKITTINIMDQQSTVLFLQKLSLS
jgi:hypothetical protein